MTPNPPVAEIIAIGSELVRGDVVDTNSSHIARRLADIGIETHFYSVVGDVAPQIVEVLENACRRSDLIIVTGGLGPTKDDITRQAVASVSQTKLVFDQASWDHIEQLFRHHGYTFTDNNRAQAMIPEGASVIPNPRGTAPGFSLEISSALLITLPGVPGEMQAMLEASVIPDLVSRRLGRGASVRRKLNMFGEGESSIDSKVGQWLAPSGNPSVGITARAGVITIALQATAADEESARNLIAEPEKRIRAALGELVFGSDDETLQEAVAKLLVAQGLKIAVAESCTGGLLMSRLVEVPGISQALMGGVVAYSNDIKGDKLGVSQELLDEKGAVSSEVAQAMAAGVREHFSADLGVAITGIAGPTGGTPEKPVGLVYIALVHEGGSEVRACHFRGGRADIRSRSVSTALNLLRLHLLHRQASQ